jgi:hypothetical protein
MVWKSMTGSMGHWYSPSQICAFKPAGAAIAASCSSATDWMHASDAFPAGSSAAHAAAQPRCEDGAERRMHLLPTPWIQPGGHRGVAHVADVWRAGMTQFSIALMILSLAQDWSRCTPTRVQAAPNKSSRSLCLAPAMHLLRRSMCAVQTWRMRVSDSVFFCQPIATYRWSGAPSQSNRPERSSGQLHAPVDTAGCRAIAFLLSALFCLAVVLNVARASRHEHYPRRQCAGNTVGARAARV